MQLQPYVHQLQHQLAAAAALGDDRTRETAHALAATAEPAMRLAVVAAVSAAAEEITAGLLDSPGAPVVTVHLDGDELRVDVRSDGSEDTPPVSNDDGDMSARISLRLSDALKTDIESAARRDAASVNAWLVRAAGAALGARRATGPHRQNSDTHRISGWINS